MGRKFGELTLFEHLVKKVWRINRSANRLPIVSTKLDSLAKYELFTKFAKLSPTKLSRYMVTYFVEQCFQKINTQLLKTGLIHEQQNINSYDYSVCIFTINLVIYQLRYATFLLQS